MQIQTKYHIDTFVWYIGNGCLVRGRITSISIDINDKNSPPWIRYNLFEGPDLMAEMNLFETKEALIQSL